MVLTVKFCSTLIRLRKLERWTYDAMTCQSTGGRSNITFRGLAQPKLTRESSNLDFHHWGTGVRRLTRVLAALSPGNLCWSLMDIRGGELSLMTIHSIQMDCNITRQHADKNLFIQFLTSQFTPTLQVTAGHISDRSTEQ